MNIQTGGYNHTHFGMAVKLESGIKPQLVEALTKRGAKIVSEIVEKQKNNPTDINIYSFSKNIYAKVDGKVFRETDSVLPRSAAIVKAIKRASKYAFEQQAKKNLLKNPDVIS